MVDCGVKCDWHTLCWSITGIQDWAETSHFNILIKLPSCRSTLKSITRIGFFRRIRNAKWHTRNGTDKRIRCSGRSGSWKSERSCRATGEAYYNAAIGKSKNADQRPNVQGPRTPNRIKIKRSKQCFPTLLFLYFVFYCNPFSTTYWPPRVFRNIDFQGCGKVATLLHLQGCVNRANIAHSAHSQIGSRYSVITPRGTE